MGWKRFLKPDLRKVVVFVIICCVYFALANLFKIILNVQNASPLEAYAYMIFVVLFLLPSSILGLILFMIETPYATSLTPSEFGGLSKNPLFYAFSILGRVLNLIYWYCLSCLIVWAYDRLKKKPREKKRK